jgi:UDP-glucose 4-epimerase
MKKIFVTGAAGYIGSHTCVELLNAGFDVLAFDNLCNSSSIAIQRVETITGKRLPFVKGDVRNPASLTEVLQQYKPDAVIHFAGLKAVGESVEKPLDYYDNNVQGSLNLVRCMQALGIKNLVFSSSATVYGDPEFIPLTETAALRTTNPYGASKLMVENILRDFYASQAGWGIALLRYFNPVGAHKSGLIGEDPRGIPNNLMPFVAQVAVGRRAALSVYGNDYNTPDGTGVRDYIHVLDLARGHLAAVNALLASPRLVTVNLGTGQGYSVLDMVKAFEQASGKPVPFNVVARRPGDIATCYSDPALALSELGWRAEENLQTMCEDAWRWQSANPHGFEA